MPDGVSCGLPRKKPSQELATIEQIERSIHIIRGQRVMLDSDLAELYGVTTKQLNQQVSRNKERFPRDFSYLLTQQEFTNLKSRFVTSSSGYGGRRKLPRVFTEQGVAMLSSVLNSPTAVRVNIEIMRTFVRLRRLMATPGELVEQLTKLAETVQVHDDRIKVILQVLQQIWRSRWNRSGRLGFMRRARIANRGGNYRELRSSVRARMSSIDTKRYWSSTSTAFNRSMNCSISPPQSSKIRRQVS